MCMVHSHVVCHSCNYIVSAGITPSQGVFVISDLLASIGENIGAFIWSWPTHCGLSGHQDRCLSDQQSGLGCSVTYLSRGLITNWYWLRLWVESLTSAILMSNFIGYKGCGIEIRIGGWTTDGGRMHRMSVTAVMVCRSSRWAEFDC